MAKPSSEAPLSEASSHPVLSGCLEQITSAYRELSWIADYIYAQERIAQEIAWLDQEIQAVRSESEDEPIETGWIEDYTVTKGGKTYHYKRLAYYQKQKKHKNQLAYRHLSGRAVAKTEAALYRGKQIRQLKQQQKVLRHQSEALLSLVLSSQPRFLFATTEN